MSDWLQNVLHTEEGKRALQRQELLLSLSCFISEQLEKNHTTQAELAIAIESAPSQVCRWLSGDRDMPIQRLSDMAFVLGYDLQINFVPRKEP